MQCVIWTIFTILYLVLGLIERENGEWNSEKFHVCVMIPTSISVPQHTVYIFRRLWTWVCNYLPIYCVFKCVTITCTSEWLNTPIWYEWLQAKWVRYCRWVIITTLLLVLFKIIVKCRRVRVCTTQWLRVKKYIYLCLYLEMPTQAIKINCSSTFIVIAIYVSIVWVGFCVSI